jgi:hypothetical protein
MKKFVEKLEKKVVNTIEKIKEQTSVTSRSLYFEDEGSSLLPARKEIEIVTKTSQRKDSAVKFDQEPSKKEELLKLDVRNTKNLF